MRKILFLCLLFWSIFITVSFAQSATVAYTDPTGHFTVDIPDRWTDQSTNIYGRFTSPDSIDYYLLALSGDDIPLTFQLALALFEAPITSNLEPSQRVEIPILDSLWTQYIYTYEGGFDTILGRVDDGIVTIVYVHTTSISQLQSATPDLVDILISFQLGTVIDLSDAEARILTEDDYSAFSTYIETAISTFDVPAVAVAVVRNGNVEFIQTYGITSVGGNVPITSDTYFLTGVLTQPMTTMMMGTLVDDGTMNWDQSVTEIYPDFALSDPARTEQMRVRDLVNHASGVTRNDLPLLLGQSTPQNILTSLSTLAIRAPLGLTFDANNQLMATGGYVSALANGASIENVDSAYRNLMQSRIFDPISMTATTFDFDTIATQNTYAYPHGLDLVNMNHQPFPNNEERWVEAVQPALGAWSTIHDMSQFLITAMQAGITPDGTEVISTTNLLETWLGEVSINTTTTHGMGWFSSDYQGVPTLTQSGGTLGYTADMAFIPSEQVGIVILTNRVAATNFTQSVRETLFELLYGLEPSARERYANIQASLDDRITRAIANINQADLLDFQVDAFIGNYNNNARIVFINNTLRFEAGFISAPLAPILNTDNNFVITSGALTGGTIAFAENDTGTMSMTVTLSAGTVVYEQVD